MMTVYFRLNGETFIGRVIRTYTLDIGMRRCVLYTVRLASGGALTIDARLARTYDQEHLPPHCPNLAWTLDWRPEEV